MTDSSRDADDDSVDEPERTEDDDVSAGPDEDSVHRALALPDVASLGPLPVSDGPDHIDELSIVDEDPLASTHLGGLAWLAPKTNDQEQAKADTSDLIQALETPVSPYAADLDAFYDANFGANFDRISRKLGVLFRGDISYAEDITQQAFEVAYKHWPRIAAMHNPYGYIAKIAWNLAMKWFRVLGREQNAAGLLAAGARDASTLDYLDLEFDLARALSKLPEHERHVIGLSLMGYPLKEIAKILEIPQSTVRSRLKRARERLKGFMDDFWGGFSA